MRSCASGAAAEGRAAAAVVIQRVWRGWWSRRVLVDGVELSFNAICAELDGELLSRHPWSWPAVESSATRAIQRAVAAEADTPPRRCSRPAAAAADAAEAPLTDHVKAPQHDLSPATDSTIGCTHVAAGRSAPSTPLHCPAEPADTATSKPQFVGSALLQDKGTPKQRDDLEEQQLQPEDMLAGSAEPAQDSGDSIGSAPGNAGSLNGSSTPALPAESGRRFQMSEEERRKVAEKLESELRWTEAALQSRVQHLIDTKQFTLSPTR